MRKIIVLILLTVCFLGCDKMVEGEGDVLTREYQLSEFHGVLMDLPGNLEIMQGDAAISVTTNENLFEWLNLFVRDGILHLEIRNDANIWHFDALNLRVTLPEPDYLKVDGSGDVFIGDRIITDGNMEVTVDGSGDVIMHQLKVKNVTCIVDGSGNIRCDSLSSESVHATIDGSGNINLCGETVDNSVSIEGSGDYRCYGLVCDNASVLIDGSGDCHLSVTQTLTVDIEGSGSVYYSGSPQTNIRIDGSGSVRKVD